jgi:hypothetical protein
MMTHPNYPVAQAQPAVEKPARKHVWMLFGALFFWVSSIFAGPTITWVVSMTEADWRMWVGLRFVVAAAGAAAVGLVIAVLAKKGAAFLPTTGVCLVIGMLANFNAVIDFVKGPIEVNGPITDLSATRQLKTGAISYHYRIQRADGGTLALDPMPTQHLEQRWARCFKVGAKVHLVVLEHLDAPLDASCAK